MAFAIARLAGLTGDPWVAAVAASAAFALAHVYQGWIGPLRTGLSGLAFSVGFIATSSLIPSILAHTLLNVMSRLLFRAKEGVASQFAVVDDV